MLSIFPSLNSSIVIFSDSYEELFSINLPSYKLDSLFLSEITPFAFSVKANKFAYILFVRSFIYRLFWPWSYWFKIASSLKFGSNIAAYLLVKPLYY